MKRISLVLAVAALAALAVIVGGDIGLKFGRPKAAPVNEAPAGTRIDRDPTSVFERAFWRRVGPDVRVLAGERREWLEDGAVQKWQWFLALQTTPEFRRWLLEQNPFELMPANPVAANPVAASAVAANPVAASASEWTPDWFPRTDTLAALTAYRVRGSGLAVFVDAGTHRMFATDAGSGFAAARLR